MSGIELGAPAARPLPAEHPIEVLARAIREVCEQVDLAVLAESGDGPLALAVGLTLAAVEYEETTSALVQPGDVVGGQVVIHCRSAVTLRRGSAVDITTAVPLVGHSLSDATWVGETVLRYQTGRERVMRAPGVWPLRS